MLSRKILWIIAGITLLTLAILGIFTITNAPKSTERSFLFPILKETSKDIYERFITESKSALAKKDVINILLIGIDRRSKLQQGFNTDSMILVSANTKTNKILLTSVPRDLWINGNKINALYTVFGPETLLDAYEQITGLEIDGYIRVDFEDFRWLADSFGGIPINIERTFTDASFPNNSDTNVMVVTFTQGYEKMTGERALTFARSRKGTNGEGSDLMRAKRQHLLLQGMVEAIKQPESIFWPMNAEKFFNAIINQGIYTTLTLDDVYYLWDFYKDKDNYTAESLVLDSEYIYHPGMYPESPYSAWVFISKDGNWNRLHTDIQAKLTNTLPENPPVDSQSAL